jgi:hypothetical protein
MEWLVSYPPQSGRLILMIEKAQQAAEFIVSHCPNVGAFNGTGEPYGFLQETAEAMRIAKPTPVFHERYIEHVAYAMDMVARNWFLSPPAAVASVNLATRFEFYFRVLSEKLAGDGTWLSLSAQQTARAQIQDQRLSRSRISSVALAYEVMKLGTAKAVPYCAWLDHTLYASPITASNNFTITTVGDRIEYGRHAVGHGQRGDISAEGVFYGLMTAVIFHAH